jgi:hypothetical protein
MVEKSVEDNVVCLRNTSKGNYIKPDTYTWANILILSATAITTLVLVDMPKTIFSHQLCQCSIAQFSNIFDHVGNPSACWHPI